VVAGADSVAAADLVEAAAFIAVAAGAVAGVGAVVMASTVAPWLSDPAAGGTPTAFASAGTIDIGLIGVPTHDRQQEVGAPGNRHTFLFLLERLAVARGLLESLSLKVLAAA